MNTLRNYYHESLYKVVIYFLNHSGTLHKWGAVADNEDNLKIVIRPKSECPVISWVEWFPKVLGSQTCNIFAVCWFLESQWSFLSSLINIDWFLEENRANSSVEEILPHLRLVHIKENDSWSTYAQVAAVAARRSVTVVLP